MKDDPYINYNKEKRSYVVRFYKGSSAKGTERLVDQRSFGNREYGSKSKALAAARKYRDRRMVELDKNPFFRAYSRRIRHLNPRSNTGVVGVSRIEFVQKSGYHELYYSASWCETKNGLRKRKKKKFYFKEDDPVSETKALNAACRLRKKMQKLHYKN